MTAEERQKNKERAILKPFKCEICSTRFSQEIRLYNHKLKDHKVTDLSLWPDWPSLSFFKVAKNALFAKPKY